MNTNDLLRSVYYKNILLDQMKLLLEKREHMQNQSTLDMNLIRKYCGYTLSTQLKGVLENKHSKIITITNTGMVSSGKSSLYNILTENFEEEIFPTGSARTTTNANEYEFHNLKFVDTPGIDVRDADDQIAYRTLIESDIVIMVHNIKTGPLTRSESEWLAKIVSGLNSLEMCKERLIFVCTWKDTREKEEDYSDILEEVKKMVFNIVGTEIPFFDLSIKKYIDGVKRNRETLCERSGVTEFKNFLLEYGEEYANRKEQNSRQALCQLCDSIKIELGEVKKQKLISIDRTTSTVAGNFRSRRSSWQGVFNYFKKCRDNLDKLKRELDSM